MQNSTATALANIAAQAAKDISPSLIIPGQTAADAAVDFAWWSIGTDGDASEGGGDYRRHFRAWERERRQDVDQAERGG